MGIRFPEPKNTPGRYSQDPDRYTPASFSIVSTQTNHTKQRKAMFVIEVLGFKIGSQKLVLNVLERAFRASGFIDMDNTEMKLIVNMPDQSSADYQLVLCNLNCDETINSEEIRSKINSFLSDTPGIVVTNCVLDPVSIKRRKHKPNIFFTYLLKSHKPFTAEHISKMKEACDSMKGSRSFHNFSDTRRSPNLTIDRFVFSEPYVLSDAHFLEFAANGKNLTADVFMRMVSVAHSVGVGLYSMDTLDRMFGDEVFAIKSLSPLYLNLQYVDVNDPRLPPEPVSRSTLALTLFVESNL